MEARRVIGLVAGPGETEDSAQVLVKAVLAGAREEGVKTDLIDLRTPDNPGSGESSPVPGDTGQPDGFSRIMDRIADADGIALGTSAPGNVVPDGLESTLDHILDALSDRGLAGRFSCCVCVSGNDGAPKVLRYMDSRLERLGIAVVGGMTAVTGNEGPGPEKNRADARDLGRALARAVQMDLTDPADDPTPREKEQVRQRIKSEQDRLTGEFSSYIQNDWTNGP
ncbi:MAG: NAD(P)H-dependent oxidoreductase [Methanoregula sp.]|nr:NAD(P)H-dependent oxidoreductase [Methanoregula sp.]